MKSDLKLPAHFDPFWGLGKMLADAVEVTAPEASAEEAEFERRVALLADTDAELARACRQVRKLLAEGRLNERDRGAITKLLGAAMSAAH